MTRANLDLNDRLVKRGLLVSWHGYRAIVARVRTGRCLVDFQVLSRRSPGGSVWVPCASVQVIPE